MKLLPLHVAILRISFGVVWLIDATFKWLPSFPQSALDIVKDTADAQSGWLAWPMQQIATALTSFPQAFPLTVAIIETLLALALIFGIGRKIPYIVGIVITFAIWVIAEGFGGPYGANSIDIGAAIIYVFVFWGLLLLDSAVGTAYSIDSLLAKRHKHKLQ